jgi:hypothetical protein
VHFDSGAALAPGQKPHWHAYLVELKKVERLAFEIRHGDEPPDFGHYQWNVQTLRLEGHDGRLHLHLSGSAHMPVLDAVVSDVECTRIENHLIKARYPGWNEPGSPFIRRGIVEQLQEKIRRRR